MHNLPTPAPRFWVGADPGGEAKFGLAFLDATDKKNSHCITVSSVDDAVKEVKKRGEPLGLGIDAPMWWASHKGGSRKADERIRSIHRHTDMKSSTVQSPNSLKGAALVGGMMLAWRIRQEFPGTKITESHPKAVIHAHEFDLKFFNWGNEHEHDAAIGAICAREGFERRWTFDLAKDRHESEQDPDSHWLAPIRYFWPKDPGQGCCPSSCKHDLTGSSAASE